MGTILALDLGTTGTRCLAISSNSQIVSQHYREFTQYYPESSWVEHNPEEIWNSLSHCINEVTKVIDTTEIVGVSITNQRETAVAWNQATGKALAPAIVWQCRRTSGFCKEQQSESPWIRSKTGLPLDAYFSATKFTWFLKHIPECSQLAKSNQLCLGTIDTWIISKLTQGKSFVTDVSNASRTLLYNIHTLEWDSELCNFFNIPTRSLPTVLDSDGDFGTCNLPNVYQPVPILSVLGDQQAALFAQCGSNPELIKNTYGTGLFLMTCTNDRLVSDDRLLSTIAWRYNGRTEYAIEGSVFVGGSAIQWCRDELGLISSAEESESLAQSLPSNDNVFFVPALTGLGAPYWDSFARGTIIGLTRGTGKAHIVRAALESIAYQTADVFHVMESLQEKPFSELLVDGGASSNNFLMQFQSDLMKKTVKKASLLESTSFGVAALGFIKLGIWCPDSFRNVTNSYQEFHPNKNTIYDSSYSKWKDAVHRAQSWEK